MCGVPRVGEDDIKAPSTLETLGKAFPRERRPEPGADVGPDRRPGGPTRINPQTEMSVVCPNCYAMIHRRRDTTLTVQDVQRLLRERITQMRAA